MTALIPLITAAAQSGARDSLNQNNTFDFSELIKKKTKEAADEGDTSLHLSDFGVGGLLGSLGGQVAGPGPYQPPAGSYTFQDIFPF